MAKKKEEVISPEKELDVAFTNAYTYCSELGDKMKKHNVNRSDRRMVMRKLMKSAFSEEVN